MTIEKRQPYSADEHLFIVNHVAEHGAEYVAKALGRTAEAIRVYCKRRKIKIPRAEWTEEEVEFLQSNLAIMSFDEIAKALGKTQSAVTKYANSHGLVRSELSKSVSVVKRKSWSADDIAYLKANVATKTFSEIASHLGRAESAVTKYANSAGIKRNAVNITNFYSPSSLKLPKSAKLFDKDFFSFEKLNFEADYENYLSNLESLASDGVDVDVHKFKFTALPKEFYDSADLSDPPLIALYHEDQDRMYDSHNLFFVKYSDALFDLNEILRELPEKVCDLNVKRLIETGEYEFIILTQRKNPNDWIGLALISNTEFKTKGAHTFNIMFPLLYIRDKHRKIGIGDFFVENLVLKFFNDRLSLFINRDEMEDLLNFSVIISAPELDEIGTKVFNYFVKLFASELVNIHEETIYTGYYIQKIIGNKVFKKRRIELEDD